MCLETPANIEITDCSHIILCTNCVSQFLNTDQRDTSSIQKDCPICRAHITHLTAKTESTECNILYAPGIGYLSLKDLLSRTFYNSVGVYWRYYYCPPPEVISQEIQSYLHSTEEKGYISRQGG